MHFIDGNLVVDSRIEFSELENLSEFIIYCLLN